MNYSKKVFSIFLVVSIIISLMPQYSYADSSDIAVGKFGDADWKITESGELQIGLEGDTQEIDCSTNNGIPWKSYKSKITRVTILGNLLVHNSTSRMFEGLDQVTHMDLSGLDTSQVVDMSYMFHACNSLTELNLSGFDTRNVTDMSYMFYFCQHLTSLDISSFDTSNVIRMDTMFAACESLPLIDVSNFDTGNVISMSSMFDGCSKLSSIDISHFDTSNVTSMSSMFDSCKIISSIDVSHFDTGNVTSMNSMFDSCRSLTNLDVSQFDTSNVTDMFSMFNDCECLKYIDVSGFNTSKVKNMNRMFSACYALSDLDVTGFDTSNVTDMRFMFSAVSSLRELDLSSFYIRDDCNITSMILYNTLNTLITPNHTETSIELPHVMYDSGGNEYSEVPASLIQSVTLYKTPDGHGEQAYYSQDPEPNNDFSQALEIEPLSTKYGSVDKTEDPEDYYYFIAPRTGNIRFSVYADKTDYDYSYVTSLIYDSNYTFLNETDSTNTDSGYAPDTRVESGKKYYVKIHGNMPDNHYASANYHFYFEYTGDGEINIYNLRDETYSFKNFSDVDAWFGHCFGMSITSSGYYLGILNRSSLIGGDSSSSLYSYNRTDKVKKPICYYQFIQGSISEQAIVAGGSYYHHNPDDAYFDIESDWNEVINYVKDHDYDNTGSLQLSMRKRGQGGHAVNFLNYQEVYGQQRIYICDSNYPTEESYIYKASDGKIYQEPVHTFTGSLDCVALRDVSKYFEKAISYNPSRNIYAQMLKVIIKGQHKPFSMDSSNDGREMIMYELPDDLEQVDIIPISDDASFIYMDKEYSFGPVDEDTYGTLYLGNSNGENDDVRLEITDGQGNTSIVYGKKLEEEVPTPIIPEIVDGNIAPAIDTAPSEIVDLPAVKISKPAAAKKSVNVKWKKVSNKNQKKIGGIEIQVATDSDFTDIVKSTTAGKKKTSKKIKGLKSKKTYWVRIRSYKNAADGKHVSAWKTKKFKAK